MVKQLLRQSAPRLAPTVKRRTRFGEQTFGNNIQFTIDGEETFKKIYASLYEAQKCILIANYDIDPQLSFVRSLENSAGGDANEYENYPLYKLLLDKAENGVEVKVIVWEPRPILRLLPGADERGIDGRAEQVQRVYEIAKRRGLENLLVKVDETSPSLTSAHHEKIIVVDNIIGFCGGLDLSKGKWDTSDHEYMNPLRDRDAEPWHDVQLFARGPIVWDLVYHFHQRWMFPSLKSASKIRKMRIDSNYGTRGREGKTQAIALRTWKELNRNGGIQSWYASMFRKAKDSIYIENQFPFQDSFATELLLKSLHNRPSLKVIIVGPMEPNLPGFVGSMIANMSVNDIRSNLARLRSTGGNRVGTYSLIAQDRAVPERRRQIYVHSKVMIVDDKWVTVGSANIDKNGFKDSSELNIGLTSSDLAINLRTRLWAEHLGEEKVNFVSFEEGFDKWNDLALENGRRIKDNQLIKGHVYSYNFEEMDCPQPYVGAKKSTQFALL